MDNIALNQKTIDREFIKYLHDEIYSKPMGYVWSYGLRDTYDWLDDDLHRGNTLEEATSLLNRAAFKLKEAIETNNKDLCFEAVRAVMDWGKVFYPQGARSMNQSAVTKLYEQGLLIPEIEKNTIAIQEERFKEVTLMNSGWTKIWAVLYPESFIMLDDRVSYAFGNIIQSYCKEKELPVKEFAKEIGFYQVGHNKKRTVDGITGVYNRKDVWVKSMISVSNCIRAAIDVAMEIGDNHHEDLASELRYCEVQLFMAGA